MAWADSSPRVVVAVVSQMAARLADMATVSSESIEFENDGIIDSLTLSMAPSLFHENLKREISSAERENRELVLLSLSLTLEKFPSLARAQAELIALAFGLKQSLRGGDFFSRISDSGFWVLLRASEGELGSIIDRLGFEGRGDLTVELVARRKDSYDEWINRIDLIHFR